jgi:Ni,Fe-hydrogenase III large subunit
MTMPNPDPLAIVRNGLAMARRTVPELSAAAFRQTLLDAVSAGQRVVSLFANPVGKELEICLVLANDPQAEFRVAATRVPAGAAWQSLTPDCPQIHLFEREMAEQCGLALVGHPWAKPVRFQAPLAGAAVTASEYSRPQIGVMDFYRVAGDQIHEVAVGPVHAGVIEPGHFRFQCHGEEVFHLEISLGYQHRGVERALIGGPDSRSMHYAQTLAGDTTIGHATAHCQILEALSGSQKTARAQALRGVGLELERLANHAGDLGALAGDVGFLPTASFCGRIRGDFLNMTATLCGNRFGRALLRPGGVRFDVTQAVADDLCRRLDQAQRDCTSAINLLWDSPSVMARFEDIGILPREIAVQLGIVGPAARACGLLRDVRADHPAGIFRFSQIPTSSAESGDVFARAYVRWLEMQRSLTFLKEQLQNLPAGAIHTPIEALQPGQLAISVVEGWRGELCHVALTDDAGRFTRYKVVDPSFHNWPALAYVLRNGQISDFPLCNKSFNLSYCGHDL